MIHIQIYIIIIFEQKNKHIGIVYRVTEQFGALLFLVVDGDQSLTKKFKNTKYMYDKYLHKIATKITYIPNANKHTHTNIIYYKIYMN